MATISLLGMWRRFLKTAEFARGPVRPASGFLAGEETGLGERRGLG